MMNLSEKKHSIDILFPISLFFVFALSALIVVVLAANMYSSVNRDLKEADERTKALIYISQKLHMLEAGAVLEIKDFEYEGRQKSVIVISSYYDGITYCSYIYNYRGFLCEYMADSSMDFMPGLGQELMEVKGLTITPLTGSLFSVSETDAEGHVIKLYLSERSAS